jgi:NAD(P)H-nitrite reductase large subunit
MGLILDEKYHGLELPNKFKMSVSGCVLNCSESWVRDIGLTGYEDGWTLTAGGNVGAQPRIGQEVAKALNDDQALVLVEKVIQYFKATAKKGERLGKMIDRTGFDTLKAAVS